MRNDKRRKHTARQQVKSKRCLDVIRADGNDDSVACVVSARTSSTNVYIGRQDVHQFTLPLIAPLGPEDNGYCPILENGGLNNMIRWTNHS